MWIILITLLLAACEREIFNYNVKIKGVYSEEVRKVVDTQVTQSGPEIEFSYTIDELSDADRSDIMANGVVISADEMAQYLLIKLKIKDGKTEKIVTFYHRCYYISTYLGDASLYNAIADRIFVELRKKECAKKKEDKRSVKQKMKKQVKEGVNKNVNSKKVGVKSKQ